MSHFKVNESRTAAIKCTSMFETDNFFDYSIGVSIFRVCAQVSLNKTTCIIRRQSACAYFLMIGRGLK